MHRRSGRQGKECAVGALYGRNREKCIDYTLGTGELGEAILALEQDVLNTGKW
jgi:hypothetical protein